MYIDHISRRPSIREANRIETVQAKNVNIKKLKMLDKQIAREFINGKYHGGRLYLGKGFGSWFKKVKRFSKKAFNKVIKPAYKKIIKPGLNFLTQNETGKALVNTVSNVMSQAAEMVPVVGPVIAPIVKKELPTVLGAADNITTAAENIVKSIKEKNPQITVQQSKDILNTIKNTYNSLNEDVKKIKEEQTKKAIESLPETIKAEGFEAVMKAAPFLPIVDLATLKEEQSQGRGGKIKLTYKIRKPKGADQLGKYSAPIVARVAGRIFLSGEVNKSGSCDKHVMDEVNNKVISPKQTKTDKNIALLEQLRKKYI